MRRRTVRDGEHGMGRQIVVRDHLVDHCLSSRFIPKLRLRRPFIGRLGRLGLAGLSLDTCWTRRDRLWTRE